MQSLELDAYVRNSSRDDVPGNCCAAVEILTNHRKAPTTRRALLSRQGLHVTNSSNSTDIVFAVSEAAADPVHKCAAVARLHGARAKPRSTEQQIARRRNPRDSRQTCRICICKVATGWHC